MVLLLKWLALALSIMFVGWIIPGITISTLGLFVLVINAFLLMFVAYLIPGVEVDGFWSAFWGAIILSILSIGISWL